MSALQLFFNASEMVSGCYEAPKQEECSWPEVCSYIVFNLWEKILLKTQAFCMCVCFTFHFLSKLVKGLLSP